MGASGCKWGPAPLLFLSLGVAIAMAGASAGGEVAAVPALVPHATAADRIGEAVRLAAPAAQGASQEDESKQLEGMLHWCAACACSLLMPCDCCHLLCTKGDDR